MHKQQLNKKESLLIQEVNNFITEMELNDEILGLKTKADKILYYHNYIDKENIFAGKVIFSSLYYIQLANYLCNTPGRLELFKEKIYDPMEENMGKQFRSFRRYLLDTRELNINAQLLQEAIDTKDMNILHECLQELWLNPFHISWMDAFKEKINEGLNGQDIINWYNRGSSGNALSILTFYVKYLKSFNN